MSAHYTMLEPPPAAGRVSLPTPRETVEHNEARDVTRGGLIAGLLAGSVLSLVMTVLHIATGQDLWIGMKLAGYPVLGEEALQPGFEPVPVIIGLLCHLTMSAVWGILFGIMVYRMSRPATVVFGVFWGVVVWLAMYYLVLPVVGAGALARAVPIGFATLEHVLFGLVLAIGFLPYQLEHRLA